MEGTKKWIVILINLVLFIACMALVIVGQKTIEVKGLVMQLVGLAGILALIYVYNRKYQ
ncbi:MAG: hypothetical protein HFI82_01450 [Eubacterium sp.]|jgi:hypothetical protein|nr:hypothetical protein [Eubacterium sp.]